MDFGLAADPADHAAGEGTTRAVTFYHSPHPTTSPGRRKRRPNPVLSPEYTPRLFVAAAAQAAGDRLSGLKDWLWSAASKGELLLLLWWWLLLLLLVLLVLLVLLLLLLLLLASKGEHGTKEMMQPLSCLPPCHLFGAAASKGEHHLNDSLVPHVVVVVVGGGGGGGGVTNCLPSLCMPALPQPVEERPLAAGR